MKSREIPLLGLGVGLAFIAGILVGRTACRVEPEQIVKERLVVETGPTVEKIVFECPPDETTPKETTRPSRSRHSQTKRAALPPAPPAASPAQRQRLLAWTREMSDTLVECRPDVQDPLRLTVDLRLGQTGTIDRVVLGNAPAELGSKAASCIRARIRTWKLPDDLQTTDRDLVFGLTL
jgi:hypothetical protein